MQGSHFINSAPLPLTKSVGTRLGWVVYHGERIGVGAILLLFLLFGIGYSLVVPPFEAPDEIHHYAFARHLSQGNGLPVQTEQSDGPWEHEGTQAPLYYLVLGRLLSGIDQSDFDQINVLNPHANLGDPLFPGNKNRMLYSARALPLSGTNLAVHIGRWFSLTLGLITLLLTHSIAKMAFPGSKALPLLVLLTVATIPQFQFISATVSNDNLAITLSTATLYWLARLLARADKPVVWHEWLVLGVLVGLAALSKLHALGLVVLIGCAVLGLAWLYRDRWLPIRAGVLVLIPALLIAGWWYWRNYTLYGEWLGVSQLLTINGLRVSSRTVAELLGELRGVRYSFWGLFGWFSILLPSFIYSVLDIVSLIALSGVVTAAVASWRGGATLPKTPSMRIHLLLLSWAFMLAGLMFYWLTFATSGQGRLLFPAISAYGLLIVTGLAVWIQKTRPSWRIPLFLLTPLGLMATSFFVLTVQMPDAYHVDQIVTALPPRIVPYHVIYGTPEGGEIELLGAEVVEGRYQPGDKVEVTLYMRAAEPIQRDYPLFVQLLAQEDMVLGNVTTHPGWGRLPTSLWEPGQIYSDRYQIPVWDNVSNRSPLSARVFVGFIEPKSRLPLPIRTEDGSPVDRAFVGALSVVARQPLDPSVFYLRSSDVDFSSQIRLIGYEYPLTGSLDREKSVSVTLLWESTAQPTQDYTAFVHIINEQGEQVSGFDQPPAEGRFPTSDWQPGDRSLSRFPINLPSGLSPGTYELWIGLYSDTDGLERLPVASTTNTIGDQRVLLGTLRLQ